MKKIENNFVPHKQALELKELGFDEECLAVYKQLFWHSRKPFILTAHFVHSFKKYCNSKLKKEFCAAPLWQQAFDWFREKYNIVQTIYSNASGYIWELHYDSTRGGTHICDSGENGDCEMSGMFTTYEKARLACLEKLIEIVKSKTCEHLKEVGCVKDVCSCNTGPKPKQELRLTPHIQSIIDSHKD